MRPPAPDVHVVPAGDTAFLVEFPARMDAAISACVIALWHDLRERRIPGVRDLVPAYATLAVYFDPLRTDVPALVALLERAAAAAGSAAEGSAAAPAVRPIHRIPVCYGGELGPDLEEIAAETGLSRDEVIRAHAGATYRVFMLGFMPGFAYMGEVDRRIAAPRRPTPRLKVPAGSVGIAGRQTGIYPMASPGGWRLVGRTPVRPFLPGRDPAFLFQAGDAVQFVPVALERFHELEALEREGGPRGGD
ncbi:MAG: 5-oxoprolinase subunit PxpB [Vicinamibacterales bacterium]